MYFISSYSRRYKEKAGLDQERFGIKFQRAGQLLPLGRGIKVFRRLVSGEITEAIKSSYIYI